MLSELVPDEMVDRFLKRVDIVGIQGVRPMPTGVTLVTYLHQHQWTEELKSCVCGAGYPATEHLAVAAENIIRNKFDITLVEQLAVALCHFRALYPR